MGFCPLRVLHDEHLSPPRAEMLIFGGASYGSNVRQCLSNALVGISPAQHKVRQTARPFSSTVLEAYTSSSGVYLILGRACRTQHGSCPQYPSNQASMGSTGGTGMIRLLLPALCSALGHVCCENPKRQCGTGALSRTITPR